MSNPVGTCLNCGWREDSTIPHANCVSAENPVSHPQVTWVVLEGDGLAACLRCGDRTPLARLPMTITDFVKRLRAVSAMHAGCMERKPHEKDCLSLCEEEDCNALHPCWCDRG